MKTSPLFFGEVDMKRIGIWFFVTMIVGLASGCAHDDPFFKALLKAPSAEGEAKAEQVKGGVPVYRYCQGCLLDDGGRLVKPSASLKGDIERAELRDGQIILSGWAADVGAGTPAKRIVLVSDAGVVASAAPNLPRPDVGAALSLYKTIAFGFEISAPEDKIGSAAAIWVIGADDNGARLEKVFRR